MISEIVVQVLLFLRDTPIQYFLALLALNVILLILLITRRKKTERSGIAKEGPEFSLETALEATPPPPGKIEEQDTKSSEAPPPAEKAIIEKPDITEEVIVPEDEMVSKKNLDTILSVEEKLETPVYEKRKIEDNQERISEKTDDQVPTGPPIVEKRSTLEKPVGLFTRLKNGLTKSRKFLNTDIDQFFVGRKKIDEELLEDLEELLITADLGVQTAMDLIESISKKASDITNPDALKQALKFEIRRLLDGDTSQEPYVSIDENRPHVIMVVGVNGVGKTTTIGKLASHLQKKGKKVLIAAADTFRAAAVEQVKIWAERSEADLVCHQDGSDPAAVAYDGVDAGIARGCDVVIVDTAGRLHTKTNLMEELKKIKRSVNKRLESAPHEILLVLDATTGQNAVTQAEMFHEALDLTGIALTKLDGTAKGGIVISIVNTLNVPLKYIGVGEHVNDLQHFDPKTFVDALF